MVIYTNVQAFHFLKKIHFTEKAQHEGDYQQQQI